MKQVNAIGDACPMPVIKTKEALGKMDFGKLEVLVDNEIAVQNVQKFAKSIGAESSFTKQDEYYAIQIEKKDGHTVVSPDSSTNISKEPFGEKYIVVISSDKMGSGDDVLGKVLMKGFVFALTQMDTLPGTILLYNSGAYLTIEESDSLNDFIAMEKLGVKILTCGTCLNHFNISDKLAVGEVTNMYSIVEEMRQANRILRP